MKILLQETPEESGSKYKVYVEVKDSIYPTNLKHIQFSSVWTGAKNPEAHQVHYEVMLNKQGIQALKQLLDSFE